MAIKLPPLPPLPRAGRPSGGGRSGNSKVANVPGMPRVGRLPEPTREEKRRLPWGSTQEGRWYPTGRKYGRTPTLRASVGGRCAKCHGLRPAEELVGRWMKKEEREVWVCKDGCD